LPGILIPKEIENTSYVDGGIMMNLPIEALV
jgi:predicted acylesterase/phospholipase RssA